MRNRQLKSKAKLAALLENLESRTMLAAPEAPSLLTADVHSYEMVDLAWTDNSADETGFVVQRKIGAGGTWEDVTTVAANVESYRDEKLSPGLEYYWRVAAVNVDGQSGYSNEVSAVPHTASSLYIDVRLPGGGKSYTFTSLSETVTAEVWAVVTGADSDGSNEAFQRVSGSFLSFNSAMSGSLSLVLSAPFNGTGSSTGAAADLDNDGDMDLGSNNNSSLAGHVVFSADASQTGGTVTGPTMSFKLGEVTFTAEQFWAGAKTYVNLRVDGVSGGFAFTLDGEDFAFGTIAHAYPLELSGPAVPDSENGTAEATTPLSNVTAFGGTTYTFNVTYTDNLAVSAATLGDNDILVNGPGLSQFAELVSMDPVGNAASIVATYQITIPGGWTEAHRGSYSVSIPYGVVLDTAGNSILPGTFASFEVRLWPVAQVGVYRNGIFILDSDNSKVWSQSDTMFRATSETGAIGLVGDWNGDGRSDIGIFKNGRFTLDTNGDKILGAGDASFGYGLAGDLPVVGDWNGDGRDEVGIYRNGLYALDTDGNRGYTNADATFGYGKAGDLPVAGDWNGDGIDEVGICRNGLFALDTDGNRGYTNADALFWYGKTGDRPVAGDWNGDGLDEVGISRGGLVAIDLDGSRVYNAGGDQIFWYGNPTDQVVIGKWRVRHVPQATNVGEYHEGVVRIDSDGDRTYDLSDTAITIGQAGDVIVAGDWSGSGTQQLGIFRDGRFMLDMDGNGEINTGEPDFYYGKAGDLPVVGDWNGDGIDEVGIFRAGLFALDVNGTRLYDTGDVVFWYGNSPTDAPVVGDWNGDGKTDVGIRRSSNFILDSDGSYGYNVGDEIFSYGLVGDTAVAGDWNGDGTVKIGVYRDGAYILDWDGDHEEDLSDAMFWYGGEGSQPVVGNWSA